MHTPPTPIPLHGFIAWPAASSMIFLISAASLLGGVWGLLAPGLGDESRIGERFTAIGILHLYQVALLAVGWLLCRWRGGNPDAIGIAILATCFALGTAAGLDTIALDQPATTLALGIASLPLLGAGGWWLVRQVLGRCEPLFVVCAGILVIWHVIAPGWFGWSFTTHLADVAHRDPQGEWVTGLVVSIAIAASLLPAATRFVVQRDAGSPFVRRAGMRWVLILVLQMAGVLHLLLLDHAFTLNRGLSSCVAPLALCLLVLNELRHRTWGDSRHWDCVAVGGPLIAMIIATCLGPENPPTMTLFIMPASSAVLIAIAAFAIALSGNRGRMVDLGLGAVVIALLTWNSGPQWTALNWNLFLLATPIAMTVMAIRHRRHELMIGAIIVAAYGVVMFPDVVLYLLIKGIAPAALLLVLAGGGILTLAVALQLKPHLARTAAWAFALGAYHCCLRDASMLYSPIIGVASIALVLSAVTWLRRDPLLLLPVSIPVGLALLRASWAWLGIGSAFALLGAGSWLSWLRIHRPPAKSMQLPHPPIAEPEFPSP